MKFENMFSKALFHVHKKIAIVGKHIKVNISRRYIIFRIRFIANTNFLDMTCTSYPNEKKNCIINYVLQFLQK